VVRILLAMDAHVTFSEMINLVYPMLSGFKLEVSREDVVRQVLEFLDGRLRVLWRDDARTDLLDAVLACGVDDVVMARRRLVALTDFQGSEEFEDLAVAFKRAHRIVRDERALPPVPDEGLYEKDEERALHAAVAGMYDRVRRAVEDGDFTRAFAEFRKLRTPVDAFFDEVYVNVENDRVRVNRLALLGWLVGMVEPAARLDLVQFERTRDA
jgi:glycyl-tRNA synthetase beta chain